MCHTVYLQANDLLVQLPTTGAIKHGPRYVYRLWRALIDTWLGYPSSPNVGIQLDDNGGHVYIISPLIDSKRIADLLLLLVKHRLSHCRMHIYTMQRCSGEDGKFERVFKDAKEMVRGLRDPVTKKRVVVEERLKKALARLDIRFGRFQTKMIAYSRDDFAELLTTSANFHSWNFVHDNTDNVCYFRLPAADLKHCYLDPLGLGNTDDVNGAAMMHLETSSISGASELSHSLSYQPSECSSSSSMHDGVIGGFQGMEGMSDLNLTGGSSSTLNDEPVNCSTMPHQVRQTNGNRNSRSDNGSHFYATIGSSHYRSSSATRTVQITGQGGGLPEPATGRQQ